MTYPCNCNQSLKSAPDGPDHMSLTTSFVSELVWAASQADHLTTFEKRRLLQRAVVTINEMRQQASIPDNSTKQDSGIAFQSLAGAVEAQTGEQIKTALLDAANMIRTLRIYLETTTRPAGGE
ncbi:hypothetical protein [Ensifer sp. MJa1]|uniref:hypothetical protein n=1 Tax=Ensifer sp. MJa1 TaxID=2919888 RepID=UPI00300901D9